MSDRRWLLAVVGPPAGGCLAGAAVASVTGATWPAVGGLAALWLVVPLVARGEGRAGAGR